MSIVFGSAAGGIENSGHTGCFRASEADGDGFQGDFQPDEQDRAGLKYVAWYHSNVVGRQASDCAGGDADEVLAVGFADENEGDLIRRACDDPSVSQVDSRSELVFSRLPAKVVVAERGEEEDVRARFPRGDRLVRPFPPGPVSNSPARRVSPGRGKRGRRIVKSKPLEPRTTTRGIWNASSINAVSKVQTMSSSPEF